MEAGIVGLPNVGKSTLFNALTRGTAVASSRPFATIQPNVGVVSIPDARLDRIVRLVPTKKVVPASLRLVDIAGLVAGAARGAGLGNKFLTHLKEADALIHVVRCFRHGRGGEVAHVTGDIAPLRDVEIVNTELALADLETVETALPRAERASKGGDRESLARVAALEAASAALSEGRPARSVSLADAEQEKQLAQLQLLTSRRALYVLNVDEDDLAGSSDGCEAVRRHAAAEGSEVVAACAQLESELARLEAAEQREMLEGLGLAEPALAAVSRAAYRLLGLQSFFTAGPKEVRAWTVKVGANARQAAAVIHSDIARGFIRAEIHSLEDLEKHGSEKALREAGRMRTEGRDHVLRDGDICHFLFNV